jgi:hypothetical protein
MTLSKRSGVRALLIAVGLFVMAWGLFPLVLFMPPGVLVAWLMGGGLIWYAARR